MSLIKRTRRCPICKTEFSPDTSDAMPFCSQRCRSVDLKRWFNEEYSMPHVPDPEEDEKPMEDRNAPTETSAEDQGD